MNKFRLASAALSCVVIILCGFSLSHAVCVGTDCTTQQECSSLPCVALCPQWVTIMPCPFGYQWTCNLVSGGPGYSNNYVTATTCDGLAIPRGICGSCSYKIPCNPQDPCCQEPGSPCCKNPDDKCCNSKDPCCDNPDPCCKENGGGK